MKTHIVLRTLILVAATGAVGFGLRGLAPDPNLTSSVHDVPLLEYLDILHRRPTEEMVGRLAGAAVMAGHATGRLDEVLDGLRHVSRVPFDFEAKPWVQAALTGDALAQVEHRREPPRLPNTNG